MAEMSTEFWKSGTAKVFPFRLNWFFFADRLDRYGGNCDALFLTQRNFVA
jgi:hypothetical protein